MKTKIVYISGSEIFDTADIRDAFEEMRNALGLARDTVLFGVPVDDVDTTGLSADKPVKTAQALEFVPAPEIIAEAPEFPDIEIKLDVAAEKPKRGRKPKNKAETAPAETPVAQQAPDAAEKVIPILSILSGKADPVLKQDAPETATTEPTPNAIRIESVSVEKVTIQKSDEQEITTSQTVAVEDIATDDEPETLLEKTLEQLLEKMAPLREDLNEDSDAPAAVPDVGDDVSDEPESDTDATLEQLAAEFATKQDEIATTPAAAPVGKIGKLKNILPFKKAKREESGLMGDLFGWAGIAANDDEFSIPGFFTAGASKK
ncbi:MAG: hypothetical protein LBJ73_05325 [Rickettsiales bacterium]|jgi:hypothetical protein|nr:hypothetical protein [Rickettsiales bacterium]